MTRIQEFGLLTAYRVRDIRKAVLYADFSALCARPGFMRAPGEIPMKVLMTKGFFGYEVSCFQAVCEHPRTCRNPVDLHASHAWRYRQTESLPKLLSFHVLSWPISRSPAWMAASDDERKSQYGMVLLMPGNMCDVSMQLNTLGSRRPEMRPIVGIASWFTLLAPFVLLSVDVTIAADHLEKQDQTLNIIYNFASRICVTAPQTGTSGNVELSGKAKAELNELLMKIVNLGVEGAAKYQSSEWEGLLQKDLAEQMNKSRDCQLEVFRELKDKLLEEGGKSDSHGSVPDPSPRRGLSGRGRSHDLARLLLENNIQAQPTEFGIWVVLPWISERRADGKMYLQPTSQRSAERLARILAQEAASRHITIFPRYPPELHFHNMRSSVVENMVETFINVLGKHGIRRNNIAIAPEETDGRLLGNLGFVILIDSD